MNKKKVSLSSENKNFVSDLINCQFSYAIPVLFFTLLSLVEANNILVSFDNQDSQSELDPVDLSSVEFIKFLEFARDIVKYDPRFICQFLENFFDEYINLRDVEEFSPSFKCFVSLYEELCYLLPDSEQSGFSCPEKESLNTVFFNINFIDLFCGLALTFLVLKFYLSLNNNSKLKNKKKLNRLCFNTN